MTPGKGLLDCPLTLSVWREIPLVHKTLKNDRQNSMSKNVPGKKIPADYKIPRLKHSSVRIFSSGQIISLLSPTIDVERVFP